MTAALWMLTTRYVRPIEEVDALLEAHRRHLEEQHAAGVFVAWGRLVPRTGGFILARGVDRAAVDAAIAADPFTTGGVAEWDVLELAPTGGEPALLAALAG